jgi:uncharacterized protein
VDDQAVVDRTRRWISSMVIGLNLYPFARRAFDAGKIRYAVTDVRDVAALLGALAGELAALASSPAFETTLLIHPRVLGAFRDYNDFLGDAERLVEDMGLRGTVQVASFHPDYRFAGTAPDAVENYTNRAPYPMLHLLREESVSAVAGDPDALLAIPRRNVETLRGLGWEKVRERLRAADAGPGGVLPGA